MVEPRADPVHHGGDVLAHRRVVRAAARELDRRRRREQAFLIGAQPGHHGVRQPAAQQIDARADTAGAVALERAPGRGRDRGDLDRDVVEARSADLCGDRPGLDLQIDHRATAQVAAAAVEDQATDRAFRIGQHRNVVVHKLVCRGTVEEKIDALIAGKRDLSRQLLEGTGELRLTELSDAELMNLVALDLDSAIMDGGDAAAAKKGTPG